MSRTHKSGYRIRYILAAIILLVAVNALLYTQVTSFAFLESHDDDVLIRDNPHLKDGFTPAQFVWSLKADLLFDDPNVDYWQPATLWTRMLDVTLYGMDGGRHHRLNIILHTLNAVLIFVLFLKTTGALWRSLVLAALFSVHPVSAEPVAWVTARKDVLSAFFGLCSLWAYTRFTDKPSAMRHVAVSIFFVLAVMSKLAIVVLPFAFLLIDVWPLRRIAPGNARWANWKPLLYEKRLWFLLTLPVVWLLLFNPVQVVRDSVVDIRAGRSLVFYVKYLFKVLWPVPLAARYGRDVMFPVGVIAASGVVMSFISAVCWRLRASFPYLIVGWCWYLGMLAPMVGLDFFDRYNYVPMIGILAVVVWSGAHILSRWRIGRVVTAFTSVSLIVIAMSWTDVQLRYWKNSIALFQHAIEYTPDDFWIRWFLAAALEKEDRYDEAMKHMDVLRTSGRHASSVLNNMGVFATRHGDEREAVTYLEESIRIDKENYVAWTNLGHAFTALGRYEDARRCLSHALKVRPDYVLAQDYIEELTETEKNGRPFNL